MLGGNGTEDCGAQGHVLRGGCTRTDPRGLLGLKSAIRVCVNPRKPNFVAQKLHMGVGHKVQKKSR